MKLFIILTALIAFASSEEFGQNPVIAEIDAFYMKSVVEVDFSFRKFFTVKSAFIEVIARNLRNSYTNYQTTISQFPIDKLSANNRKSFDNMISSVEFWLERGVSTAEVTALNYIWTAHPNTGIRGPTTPSETHLEQSLKPSLLTLKLTISESDDACLEPFIPLIIPSYQPFTDAINFAATDQIKTINNITFKSSLESETASVEATKDLIEILNKCGSTTSTDSCIGNFLAASVDCIDCRFSDPFSGPSAFLSMDATGVASAYDRAMQDAAMILMNNQIHSKISVCRRG